VVGQEEKGGKYVEIFWGDDYVASMKREEQCMT
jgi:hypothetical protein